MYRKVASFFHNTKHLKNFDYFAKQKQKGIKIDSVPGVAKAIKNTEKDQKTFENLIKVNIQTYNKYKLNIISTTFVIYLA